ncbi:gamma-glutamyltransferase [Moraxella nasovis]|uniref:gamma-glutamyltransferase n=1 Tax=Moraxella nasovis TaxID=2904121 RepID=UPI001F60F2AE|nr:gamma-glutamyltransferase [Moraxella nasovis]UNU72884.1 gamma-glutamyltransferase [Moraxella nasovis]
MKISLLTLSLATLLAGCTHLSTTTPQKQTKSDVPQKADIAPEQGTGLTKQELVRAKEFMVASANPLATQAGYEILQQGGSAIDAMIAVQTTLGLTEPQSSGLGGGALVVYWDNTAKKLTTFDARETAPKAISPTVFLDKDGKPLQFMDAVVGGGSVGVPAIPKLFEVLHERYGVLPWRSLFDKPTKLAKDGFLVSNRLAQSIEQNKKYLAKHEVTSNYFMPNGKPLQAGALLKNADYANTLQILAKQGSKPFYDGMLAQNIVKIVNHAPNAGSIAMSDFNHYKVIERTPVCQEYRKYQVCGMGAPSSGGIALGQILGILNHYPAKPSPSPNFWRWVGNASALAFADRGKYVADADFVNVPTHALLNDNYLKSRAKLIQDSNKALTDVKAGDLADYATDTSMELPSTTHIVIVDKAGNVLSMTSSIENAFGSTLMANGYLLNNELTDFAFEPTKDGKPVANAVQGNKRPRSSMAPTIVLKDGEPYMAVGSPGGSRIIGYVAKTLVAHLDFGMDIQSAISYPNILNRGSTYELEQNSDITKLEPTLKDMGYKVQVRDLNSGVQAILLDKQNGELLGGADPRREGKVMGR